MSEELGLASESSYNAFINMGGNWQQSPKEYTNGIPPHGWLYTSSGSGNFFLSSTTI